MGSTTRIEEIEAAELVEAVASAPDPPSACSALLEHAVEQAGFRRAAVLLDDGAGLRGVVQARPGGAIGTLSVGYDEVRPIMLNAMEGEDPSVVSEGSTFPDLGFRSYLVLPLPAADRQSVGMVVAEGDVVDAEALALAAAYRRCGPPLARVLELDRLRRNGRAISRDREFLLQMVDILPDPVLLTDRDHQILMSNRRADQLLTFQPDDTEGRRRAVEVNNLLLSSHLTKSTVGGGREGRSVGELNLVDPEDGSDLVFEAFSRIDEQVGESSKLFTVLRDITDLKTALGELEDQIRRSRLAEQRTRRESERLQVIIENVGEPILVSDQRSNIILMNREAEYLFEVPPNAPGTAAETGVIRANDTRFTGLMSEFLLQPERRFATSIHLDDPDAEGSVPMEVVSTKIFDRRGEVTAVVSVLHNLRPYIENERLATELRVLNEELEERVDEATSELATRNRELEVQRRRLERASHAKSAFLAGVSHELRTPINAIVGYTALLKEGIYGELSEKQVESLGKVQSASDQLLTLISDILDLSKIEAGKVVLDVEPFSLDDVTDDIVQTIEPLVREKALDLRTELDDPLPEVTSDRAKVVQILLNLFSNAVKFTDEGGVTFRCVWDSEADRVAFEVEDTGIGIGADEIDEVFEEFHQSARTNRQARGGAGLGLAITRRLVTILGGEIFVESAPGEGSVFTVELPRHLPPDTIEESPGPES